MVRAIVSVVIEPNKTEEAFEKIKSLPGVKEAFRVYGEYDAVFVIQGESTKTIQDFVKSARKFPGVLKTVTVIEIV